MIDRIAEEVFAQVSRNPNGSEWTRELMDLYRYVEQHPAELKNVYNYPLVGKFFLLMIEKRISQESTAIERIANIGYLCLSIANEKYPDNTDIIRDRILLINRCKEILIYTVMSSNLDSSLQSSDSQISQEKLYMVEYYNFSLKHSIKNFSNHFARRWNDLNRMFSSKSITAIEMGKKVHLSMTNYLKHKILTENSLCFIQNISS